MDCSTIPPSNKQERRRMQNRAAQSKLRRRKAEEKRYREQGSVPSSSSSNSMAMPLSSAMTLDTSPKSTPSLSTSGPGVSPLDGDLWHDGGLQLWLSDLHGKNAANLSAVNTHSRIESDASQSSSTQQLQELLNEGFISLGDDSVSFDTSGCFKNTGKTPLHLAAEKGHFSIATMLIRYGADVNARDPTGATPLHCASSEGHTAVVVVLAQAAGNLNAVDDRGWTPLHVAVDGGWAETAQALLEQGAHL